MKREKKNQTVVDDRMLPLLIQNNPDQGMLLAIRQYGNAVRTICRNILADCGSAEAEDAVSECFSNIWQAAGRFNPELGASFRSYCYGIARTTALAYRRKLRKVPVLPLEETCLAALGDNVETMKNEEEELVHQVVEAMREPDRTIFLLRYFYFFKVKEIAERLDLSPKKVENILSRRKKDLEAVLREGGLGNEEIG